MASKTNKRSLLCGNRKGGIEGRKSLLEKIQEIFSRLKKKCVGGYSVKTTEIFKIHPKEFLKGFSEILNRTNYKHPEQKFLTSPIKTSRGNQQNFLHHPLEFSTFKIDLNEKN